MSDTDPSPVPLRFPSVLTASAPLLVALAAALVTSLLLAKGDTAASEAKARQVTGLARAPIVDRNGAVLAYSDDRSGTVVRRYTLPSLAAPLGYRDPSGAWHGLERRYNNKLSAARAQKDWRTFFLNLRGRSAEGDTLQLTLDRRLQYVADRALGHAQGGVVALDPRTGAVLAMVSKPYCNGNALRTAAVYARCVKDTSHPLLDRVTDLLLPPGSSFKIVTLSAALDTGVVKLSTLFSGADAFGPSPYFDNVTYPSNITRTDLTAVTLAQALAFSDNFVFAHVGLLLGASRFLTYAHRFFLDRTIPFDLPVRPSTTADGRKHPSTSVLAQSAFGAPTDQVTPLQMALVASAVANHGVLMRPYLVQDLQSPSGAVIDHAQSVSLGRVMTGKAARSVTDGMVFVVNHGSGYRAQIAGVPVAGKTGTAASGGYFPHAWFICFAPAYHPVVAVAVLHEFSGEGFKFAAPIARKVLVAALQERGYHVR